VTTEDTSIYLTLMILTEMDFEKLVSQVQLTRLIAREDFIKYNTCFSLVPVKSCYVLLGHGRQNEATLWQVDQIRAG
jgi:hypothetical protein